MDPTNEIKKDTPTAPTTPEVPDILDDLDVKLSEAEHSLSDRDISARTRAEEELAAELAGSAHQDISLDIPDTPVIITPLPKKQSVQKEDAKVVIENTLAVNEEPQKDTNLEEAPVGGAPFAYRGSVTPIEERNTAVPPKKPAEDTPMPKTSALASAKSALLATGNEVRDTASKVANPENVKTDASVPPVRTPLSGGAFITPSPSVPLNDSAITRATENVKVVAKVTTPPIPAPQPQKGEVGADDSIRPIRTFRDDIARVLQKKKTTLVDAVVAEEDRAARIKQAETPSVEVKRSMLSYVFVFVSALLVTGGLSAYGIYYFFGPTDITRVDVSDVHSFVFVEEQKEFELFDDESKRDVFRRITVEKESALLSLGSIEQLYFTRSIYDEKLASTRKMLVSSAEFIAKSEFRIESSFIRDLSPEMTFGYHAFDGTQPFLIFKTAFYENAFAAMLDWEPRMNEDLAPLFGDIVMETYMVGSSTRTRPANMTFEDVLIKNKEVRMLYDKNGKELLLYGFPTPDIIIITTNQYTFTEIVTRLQSIRI